MKTAIGFTAVWGGTEQETARAVAAQNKVIAHFPDIKQRKLQIQGTMLWIWGKEPLEEFTHILPDKSVLLLIGEAAGKYCWETVEESLLGLRQISDFRLPWEGRTLLLHISADGSEWTIWNDWLGSIPVYYTASQKFRIASTLEPVIVSANAFTSEQFFLPGILYMLMHGHFLGEWTMFRDMNTAPADSVLTLRENGTSYQLCCTTPITLDRWETSYENLQEEMHHLISTAVVEAAKRHPAWIIPISSGLDSRLIAAIAAKKKVDAYAVTWGPPTTKDVIYGSQIARKLGMGWKRIDLGTDYMEKDAGVWADLFGSSMHFHGMYQIPFLEYMKNDPSRKIISGYLGGSLSGCFTKALTSTQVDGESAFSAMPDDYLGWTPKTIQRLFQFSINDAMEEVAAQIRKYQNIMSGPWFQRIRFVDFWGRQNRFVYFQTMLGDYWQGIVAPYVNKEYARFCLSLPRIALENRRLLLDMMARFYPTIMEIPGTYSREPAQLTGKYLLKRRAARAMPRQLANLLLPEFNATKNIQTDIVNMQRIGRKAMWPIPFTTPAFNEWLNMDVIDQTFQQAVQGDINSVRKIQSIQTLAYRMMDT